MTKYLFFLLIFISGGRLFAQTPDSLIKPSADTVKPVRIIKANHLRVRKRVAPIVHDSALVSNYFSPVKDSIRKAITPLWRSKNFFYTHPFFRFTDPVKYSITIKQWQGKEAIFYSMIGLLLFFALIKNGFYRYLQDMFKIYFRTSIKHRQAKDQLLQTPMPSFLLNIFSLLSIAMFLAFVLQYFQLGTQFNFWILFFYCVLGLVAVYSIKFLSLKLTGWIFQVSDAIDTYIFIVFTTNKILGIVLLPFLVMLAFTYGQFNQAALTLSLLLVAALFAYRFFLSYVSIRHQVQISFFHFFLYLCAFEIAPLLLINKVLFRFLGETS